MTNIKEHIKMTSDTKNNSSEDEMKKVWDSYYEAQKAWQDLYNTNKQNQQKPEDKNNG